jgi:hypothetical protein
MIDPSNKGSQMAMHEITNRLNRIFENVLGCRLEFQPVDNLSTTDWDLGDLAELKSDSKLSPKYIVCESTDSFGFPVRREETLIGLAVVHGFKDSRPQRLLILAELMAMVLDYGIRTGDRNEKLRIIEERIAMLDETSNVIPLRPARYERVLQLTETVVQQNESIKSPLLTSPLLLVSTAGFPLNRIAVEIHQLSNRWAFVSAEDLPADIFNSREALEQLGGLTLFIRDISTLTTNQQLKLSEYLARSASDETPHVIAGANESIDDLVHQGKVLPYLSRLFTVTALNTSSNKSAAQITTELVNASIQHIVSNAREDVMDSHQIGDNFIPFNAQYFHPDDTSTVH